MPRLPADVDELLGRQTLKSPQEVGYQRPERIDSVHGRDENHDSNRESAEVLRGDGADVVLGQQPGERPRQRLIQQNANRQRAGLARVREQRLLDRASPWGSRRGSGPGCPRQPGNRGGSSRGPGSRETRVCPRGSRGRYARRNPMSPWASSYAEPGWERLTPPPRGGGQAARAGGRRPPPCTLAASLGRPVRGGEGEGRHRDRP